MDAVIWIAQALLALAMLGAGGLKLIKNRKDLISSGPAMGWAEDFSDRGVKVIGLLEVAAAAALVLPWALTVVPVLTPLAGAGVALLMVGAMVVHLRRREIKAIATPLLLALLGAFVAVSRFAGVGS